MSESESKYFIRFNDLREEVLPGFQMASFDGENMTAALLSCQIDDGVAETPHAHENEQINIYYEGDALMHVGDETCLVGAGWIVIIPPNVVHQGGGVIGGEPTLQCNFSSPARGKGYVKFMQDAMGAETGEDK